VVVGGTPTARTFTGTIATLNTFFTSDPAKITYTPAANASGARQLVVTIAQGAGAQRLASIARVPVTIAPVNDAPVLRAPLAFVVQEDVTGNLVWPAALPVVADVDSALVTVRLSAAVGTISSVTGAGVAVANDARANRSPSLSLSHRAAWPSARRPRPPGRPLWLGGPPCARRGGGGVGIEGQQSEQKRNDARHSQPRRPTNTR
jgi:hypothetical protein